VGKVILQYDNTSKRVEDEPLVNARIGSAPVSFGVDELQSDAWRPSRETIIGAIAGLGLAGTELGPPGFLGDPQTTRSLLDEHGLELVGAYLPLRFSRREHLDEDLGWLRAALVDLRERAPEGSSPKAIIADSFFEPDRLAFAGAIDQHPETWLPKVRRDTLVANIHRAAELCQSAGFDAVVHPHGGTYIETESEIRFVADRLEPALVGLCLDTGHIRFGGANPARIATDYAHLVRHVHAKDCDPVILRHIRDEGAGMKAAVERGVFCELGTGAAQMDEVFNALRAMDYRGWVVLEQDRKVAAGTALSDLVASLDRNAQFVRSSGLGPVGAGESG
jgi:inosose dehydratase